MDTQTKITKAYIKHKKFYDLGFNLLATATVGTGIYHIMPDVNALGLSLFASTMLFVGLQAMGNPLDRMAKNVVNQYIRFKNAYLLDSNTDVNQQPENIEAFIKHSFMGFYLAANFPARQYIHDYNPGGDNEAYKQFTYLERGSFLNKIWKELRNLPQYYPLFKQVFEQDFKHDGLLGYALSHNNGAIFDFLFQGFKGDIQFTEQDLNYLKKSNTVLFDSEFEVLFLRENYLKLPKDVREFLVSHYEKDIFNHTLKDRVLALEKEIQQMNHEGSILTDVEKAKQQDELVKAQNIIKNKENANLSNTANNQAHSIPETINELKPIYHNFSKITQEKINVILEKSLMISEKIELLEPTQAIEFKSLITSVLPKYLTVFSHTQVQANNEKEANFLSTLSLMDKYLDSCTQHIEFNTNNDFDVADNFLKNKLAQYDSHEEGHSGETKTLKMKH